MTVEERITAYLARVPPCVAGEGGDNHLFAVAKLLFNGWGLSEAETLSWLEVYNRKCEPPWGRDRLVYKAGQAAAATYQKPRGHLLNPDASDASRAAFPKNRYAGLPSEPAEIFALPENASDASDASQTGDPDASDASQEVGQVVGVSDHPDAIFPFLHPIPLYLPLFYSSFPLKHSKTQLGITEKHPQRLEDDEALPDQTGPAVKLTAEQLVVPPPELRGAELQKWIDDDMREAIGAEFIFDNIAEALACYAPPAKRSSKRK